MCSFDRTVGQVFSGVHWFGELLSAIVYGLKGQLAQVIAWHVCAEPHVKLNEVQHHLNIHSSALRQLQGNTPPHCKHGWPGRATDPSRSCALVRTTRDDN
jgi:hypothetical protein